MRFCVEILRSASRHDVEPEDILHALAHAVVVEQIGDDPSRYLVLGPDRAARLGARGSRQAARTGRHPRHGAASAVSEVPEQEAMTVATTHGTKQDGTPVTDQMIEALADEAELGYDVDELRTRNKGGRRWAKGQPLSNRYDWIPSSSTTCFYAPRASRQASPTSFDEPFGSTSRQADPW